MSDRPERPQSQVDAYLAALRSHLAGLPAADIEEILREFHGHIVERAAEGASQEAGTPIEQILQQLGSPEQIGSLYRADAMVAHARASFSPSLIIRTTVRWATRTGLGFAAFLAGFVGYAIGAALIVCAVLKPIFPADVGLWMGLHGMVLGAAMPRPQGHELLGWLIIPYGLGVGVAFILGTTVFLRWMLRFIPKLSRQVATPA